MKFCECIQKKITKNLYEAEFLIFDLFSFYCDFNDFFVKKQTKFNEIEKIQNSAISFVLFMHTFIKFRVSSIILAKAIMQNEILNKSHFCEKLQKFSSQRFFCDAMLGLHL